MRRFITKLLRESNFDEFFDVINDSGYSSKIKEVLSLLDNKYSFELVNSPKGQTGYNEKGQKIIELSGSLTFISEKIYNDIQRNYGIPFEIIDDFIRFWLKLHWDIDAQTIYFIYN
jgi:hypothetical protein